VAWARTVRDGDALGKAAGMEMFSEPDRNAMLTKVLSTRVPGGFSMPDSVPGSWTMSHWTMSQVAALSVTLPGVGSGAPADNPPFRVSAYGRFGLSPEPDFYQICRFSAVLCVC
jgi:hypothetical protein